MPKDSSESTMSTENSISRNAYNLAKSLDSTINGSTRAIDDEDPEDRRKRIKEANLRAKELEAEVMGTVKKGVTSQSDIKERNLSQMISVLHMRLANLEKNTSARFELVKEDVNTHSTKSSLQTRRTNEDIEEFGLSLPKTGNKNHKDNNLVSHTDGVMLDPIHLVLKTKQSTETAKRLEMNLDDAFGTANTRDFRGQKKKGGGSKITDTRKLEQEKFELKKQTRMRLEKELQTNMESFVTRSILDPELIFSCTSSNIGQETRLELINGIPTMVPMSTQNSINSSIKLSMEELAWPITLKWPKKDPRSLIDPTVNADGEMDPLLLLRYSIERINIPAHEQMYRWLISQTAMHNYYVHLFWLIKVKFFQNETDPENEKYLMKEMSNYYAIIITLLAERTHAEHEKDHVYKYLPFLLCNAVYFGFHFLCPGSRHLYTKGFRKTILMQIVQMMNGLQLCPISVKVSWSKLFPDEAHEEEETEDGGGESIPVQIALTQSKALESSQRLENTLNAAQNSFAAGGNPSSAPGRSASNTRGGKLAGEDMNDTTIGKQNKSRNSFNESHLSNIGQNNGKGVGHVPSSTDRRNSADNSVLTPFDSKSFTGTTKIVEDPFVRTFLKAPLERPGRYFESIRQNVETMNAANVSPLMQSLLGWDTASGERRQNLFRTVPISWCPAGGSDTHKRRTIPKELHDSISARASKIEKEFQQESIKGHKTRLAGSKLVDKKCHIMMSGGQARISQYALDLIKARRATEKGKGKNKDRDNDEIEIEVDPALAMMDDNDLDRFLDEFD